MAKLTKAKINKLNKEFDTKRKIYILEDNDEVNISVKFKESVVNSIVIEYISVLDKISKQKDITNDMIIGSIGILNLFMIREFSDVPMIPKNSNDLEENIQVANILYNTGIMDAVISQFDDAEKQKVFDKLNSLAQESGKILGEAAINAALNDKENIEE